MTALAGAPLAREVTPPLREVSSRAPFWGVILLAWAAASGLFLYLAGQRLETGVSGGPDDYLRLVQVRDFLAGQGWFDVSQHRLNVPDAAPMHWSRLVDLPVAALILLAEPFAGRANAELFAIMAVPLLIMLAVMACLGVVTRRLLSVRHVPAALFLMFCSPLLYLQLRPLRIDHHGWQIALGIAAVAALVSLRGRRAGALAGAAMAVSLQVSIEGLPFAAAIAALLAFHAWRDRAQTDGLLVYLGALAGGSALLFMLTQPAANWGAAWCDAIMPAYLAAFGASFACCAALRAQWVVGLVRRGAVLAVAAAAAGAALLAVNPACAAGPFSALDPVVHDYWYVRVQEGLPVWETNMVLAAMVVCSFVLSAAGYAAAIRREREPEMRARWITMAALFASAALVGTFVLRASAFAMLIGIPGIVFLLAAAMKRAERVRPPWRVFPMLAVLILFVPYTPGVAVTVLESEAEADDRTARRAVRSECEAPANYAELAALPPSRVLSPLDGVPAMLTATPHGFVASGHHRNNDAMREVILAFSAPTGSEAHALARRRGLDYLVVCRDTNEMLTYMEAAPGGFAEQLNEGRAPDWLQPVGEPDADQLVRIYRIER